MRLGQAWKTELVRLGSWKAGLGFTKMMVMAIDLYEDEAPSNPYHFTTFGRRKSRQFVENSNK